MGEKDTPGGNARENYEPEQKNGVPGEVVFFFIETRYPRETSTNQWCQPEEVIGGGGEIQGKKLR